LILASKIILFSGIGLLIIPVQDACSAGCTSTRGLASNQILHLSGSNDTLWILALEGNSYSLNTIQGQGKLAGRVTENSNWFAYKLGCMDKGIYNMVSGGGFAVAVTDTESGPQEIYTFRHDGGEIERKPFRLFWSDSVTGNEKANVSVMDVVYGGNCFFFACLDGGVVRWNPGTGDTEVLTPGSSSIVPIEDFAISGSLSAKRQVTALHSSEHFLAVTTPSKVRLFSYSDSSWDNTVTTAILDSGAAFRSFFSAFVNNDETAPVIYSIMELSVSGKDTVMFCKYNRKEKGWGIMLEDIPNSISFATGGYIYMTFGSNTIKAYLDTLGDSVVQRNPSPAIDRSKFERRMTPVEYGIDMPAMITDIFFTKRDETSGYLWIASSEGLFFSERETPGKSSHDFILIKRAPVVEAGLKNTYARPGILAAQGYWDGERQSRTVFVYNLASDAKVTIKVYDYNMDLVRTVIEGKARKAGKNGGPQGRSTVEKEDCWDGRDNMGRMVAPGVYYYKINTNTGERGFGKIVVAK
jgi:hypothetical protein